MAEIPIIGQGAAVPVSDPAPAPVGAPAPVVRRVSAPEPSPQEAATGFLLYRNRILGRWETIERAFQQASVGLHNDLRELRGVEGAREFHARHEELTDKFLTTTEFLFRAHNGHKE